MSQDNKEKRSKLSRRKFLQGTGLGVAAVTGMGVLNAEAGYNPDHLLERIKGKSHDKEYDVIVIGGGFAGVTAARELRQDGYKVLILEARNRLGGRTFSSSFEGHDIELGGTWIHSTQPFVWAEKERYNLEVKETPGAVPDYMVAVIDGKARQLTEAELYEFVGAYHTYIAEARVVLERPFDILYAKEKVIAADKLTAVDRLNQLELSPLQYQLMDGLLSTIAGNRADALSYVEALRIFMMAGGDFMTVMDSAVRFKFKKGTGHLIEKMVEDGKPDVRLSTPVKNVEQTSSGVQVTTVRGDKISAAAVLVTVPMNVLPAINFIPALPIELTDAANEKHTGVSFKVYLKVKGRLGKTSGMADSDAAFQFVLTYAEAEDHTLVAAFGFDRSKVDIYDDESLQAALRQMYPDAEVISSFNYDWLLDPYSQGTWCFYKPTWLEKYYSHFQSDHGRIFFGQGDHGEGWRGTIDGAIAAGSKAAQRITNLLR